MTQKTLFPPKVLKQDTSNIHKWSFQVIANGDLAVDGVLTSDNLTALCKFAEKLLRKEA